MYNFIFVVQGYYFVADVGWNWVLIFFSYSFVCWTSDVVKLWSLEIFSPSKFYYYYLLWLKLVHSFHWWNYLCMQLLTKKFACRPQVTIATAIIFCHRFFLRQSHAKNDRRVGFCYFFHFSCYYTVSCSLFFLVAVVARISC